MVYDNVVDEGRYGAAVGGCDLVEVGAQTSGVL